MNARIAPPPIWPGPEDVEGMDGDRGEAELVVVGVRHVLAGELRDRVRPARLADGADRRHLALLHAEGVRAEDLARREVDEALERVERRDGGLEHVVRADHVHAHRPDRALEDGVDARDRRAVDEVGRTARELVHRLRVEDVGLVEREVRVLGERRARERVAVEVVRRDDLVLVDEPLRERRSDEPGAAGDEDALALEHGASLLGLPFSIEMRGAILIATLAVLAASVAGSSSASPTTASSTQLKSRTGRTAPTRGR